ncbi:MULTISPECIES: serine hydrolase [unclassified Crossiella]|uniref:serine hydrolase domain-containing protein n=1 Tax=unclassified Crossiella TaxID=2620835 RepID=UPI001FFE43F2|nr:MULTISPECIES: serine hydrolase domain-containing protein [unclassified Crossiella]MCK2241962.1 beta-lactamase family protein [Crossiella sp. S99.2]MCK2255865.1 beta-lactamase family protein [Crossiella sp. S99.1]
MAEVHGTVAPGFEAVREVFARNFTEGGELGAAVCVYRHGRKVVDLWGGIADDRTGRPWQRDTLQLVYSVSKGVTAMLAHLLVERGELDLDAPVARYWPEFAAAGKQDIPVRWLLSHQAGLPALDERFPVAEVAEWDRVVARLAAQKPWWTPGTEQGYHAWTFGWLVGEVIRRVTGRDFGEVFAAEIADRVGAEVWFGLPAELEPRVSRIVSTPPRAAVAPPADLPESTRKLLAEYDDPDSLIMRSFDLTTTTLTPNTRLMHAAEIPAAAGIGTAEGFARLYAATVGEVDGMRLLAPETVERARATQTAGLDRVLVKPARWALGFIPHGQLPGELTMLGPGSFGHDGHGGSLAFGDVQHGIGFAYVMNRLQHSPPDGGCSGRLVTALRTALGQ